MIKAYPDIVDPFAGLLEYTPMKGEWDVWKSHQPGLIDAATVMRQRFIAFFRDLLLLHWPEAADRTSSWARLRALGLVVPEFDPDVSDRPRIKWLPHSCACQHGRTRQMQGHRQVEEGSCAETITRASFKG